MNAEHIEALSKIAEKLERIQRSERVQAIIEEITSAKEGQEPYYTSGRVAGRNWTYWELSKALDLFCSDSPMSGASTVSFWAAGTKTPGYAKMFLLEWIRKGKLRLKATPTGEPASTGWPEPRDVEIEPTRELLKTLAHSVAHYGIKGVAEPLFEMWADAHGYTLIAQGEGEQDTKWTVKIGSREIASIEIGQNSDGKPEVWAKVSSDLSFGPSESVDKAMLWIMAENYANAA